LLADSSEVKNHQLAFGKQVSDKDLNTALSAKIKCYDQLSGESRRALRTSEFFDSQAKESGAADSIDLSPIIDMQYKCLELTFREIFEHTVFHLIEKGDLQKKLDIIGYARPIPPKMSEFETYISKLPIVDSIPFFSKFKLRKMLRAICQFKPGKRFTLDGLKAFSLFFLVFGRKNCRYGIVNEFPLPYETDAQLAEFCKELHMLQDFRNRATHEGFHPGASNDLDKIWASTDSIITEVFRIKETLANNSPVQAPKVSKTPTIVHKKVS
jgi:hypothetical protein